MCNNQYTRVTPQVLIQAMQGEINGIAQYKQLHQLAADTQDAEIITTIHNDEIKHYNALTRIYQQMTGSAPPAIQAQPIQITSFVDGLKSAIPDELKDSESYRCIALGCDNPAQRMFSDIAADENKHAVWLNYLYLKSLEQCCCQQAPEPVECEGIVHTVQPGETLWSIGRQYAVTVEELLAENPHITDPASIYTGQIICIPCTGIRYAIQPGDSLWLIAQQNGLTVEELTAANPFLTDPANLAIGQIICIPVRTTSPTVCRDSLTYMYGGTSTYYLNLLVNTQNSITVACPDFFELDEVGNLLLAASEKLNTQFIATLHQQGIQITPFLSNHWSGNRGMAALNNREQLSTQLADAVAQYDLDGINIDIENVNHEYRSAYVDFVRLLREKLPEGKVLSVAVAANPKGWNTGWHGSYDYSGLARYSDYLVIMAYDESYQGGPEGPVSSASFFEQSIQYALDQGVPKEKIMVGIPFFGRYWKQGDSVGGIGLADRDVEYLLANYSATNSYDSAAQSALAVVMIQPGEAEPQIWGGRKLSVGTYHIWYDNPKATRYKLDIISQYGVRGAGSWALGQEIPEIWNSYSQTLNQ